MKHPVDVYVGEIGNLGSLTSGNGRERLMALAAVGVSVTRPIVGATLILRGNDWAVRVLRRAVHLKYIDRARPLVQIVDVLGHDEHLAGIVALKLCQSEMSSVRFSLNVGCTAQIVEFVDPCRIFGEGAWAGQFSWIELSPQPFLVSKRAQPAFG